MYKWAVWFGTAYYVEWWGGPWLTYAYTTDVRRAVMLQDRRWKTRQKWSW